MLLFERQCDMMKVHTAWHDSWLLSPQALQAGEYYYELFGTSSPPLPLETYKMQVKAEASGTKDPYQRSRQLTRQWSSDCFCKNSVFLHV